VFRRFDPLSRDVAKASHLVALRSVELKRLMGNLAKLATELGDRDSQLTAFVQGNEGVFHALADQDQALRQTIQLLPPALGATNTALTHATTLGQTLRSTLGPLDPSARGLGPTLSDLRPFLRDTTPVIRDQLRPFSIKAQPTARALAPAAHQLAQATPKLGTLAGELDNIVNELAYKPKNGQSYLFYLPWASHDTNSVLSNQDGIGPVRQSLILFSCGSLQLLQDLAKPTHNPPYLWIDFGGSLPFAPQGHRVAVAFPQANELATGADVRIAGVDVGKVVALNLDKADSRELATLQISRQYAPLPRDTRATLRIKTLLGETYVDLSAGRPGSGALTDGGRIPDGQVATNVDLDQILATFDPQTRTAFQTWMQSQAAAIAGRGEDINATFGNLPSFVDSGEHLLATVDSQSAPVRRLVANTGT
jgi:ABC-type transporter Mla subunit MlaD